MDTILVKALAVIGFVAATTVPATQLAASAAPADPSFVRAVAQCGSADLKAGYTSTDAGVGHRYGVLRLTNVSDQACSTGGYGGLSYVGHGDGTQIGAAADRDPGTVRTIVLQPGVRVQSRVDETVAQNYPKAACGRTHVDGFRVYVPNSTVSQYVKHETTGCSKSGVHLISHGPFVRG